MCQQHVAETRDIGPETLCIGNTISSPVPRPSFCATHYNAPTVQPIANTSEITGENAEALIAQGPEGSPDTDANEQSNGAAAAFSSSIAGFAGLFSVSVAMYAILC